MEKSKLEQLEEKLETLVKANEALEKKLSEASDAKPALQEKLIEEKKPEPEPIKENKEVMELRGMVEKLTESVSKLKEKPKGVVETEESKMKESFGFSRGTVKVEHIEGQPTGVCEIYTPDSTRENDDPNSSRRWALY